MKVSGFEISPTTIAPGDDIRITFTVKAEKGDDIEHGIYVWMSIPDYGEIVIYKDEHTKLSAGKSKTVAVITKANFGDYVPNRGRIVPSFGVQLGLYGTRKDIHRPVVLLDARYSPEIKVFGAERSIGAELDDEGENLIAEIGLAASGAAKLERLRLNINYKNAKDDSADWNTLSLKSVMESALKGTVFSIINELFAKNTDWLVMLEFGDSYESKSKTIEVSKSFANVHFSGAENGGVCFGAYSQSTNENPLFQCYYPAEFEYGIRGVTNYPVNAVGTNVSGIEVDTGGKWFEPGDGWNEGREIYRYVWRGVVTAYNTQYEATKLPDVPDIVLSLRGMLRRSDGAWLPIPFIYRTSVEYAASVRTEANGAILLGLGDKFADAEEVIIICEYVKKSEGNA